MGCKELIESLHAAGEGRARALRAEAEREIERIRTDAAKRIEALQLQHTHQQAAAAADHASQVLAEANASARLIRLRSERALAERLRGHARASLPSLRNVGYAEMFVSFVRELPAFAWRTVRVHPDDVTLARGHFPGAEVTPDPGITGGFIAASEGDQVRIANTFEQRLENLWEELLPEIMREAMDLAR
jgi:vacuolar-type H+-ATPase subunit E/Vma4